MSLQEIEHLIKAIKTETKVIDRLTKNIGWKYIAERSQPGLVGLVDWLLHSVRTGKKDTEYDEMLGMTDGLERDKTDLQKLVKEYFKEKEEEETTNRNNGFFRTQEKRERRRRAKDLLIQEMSRIFPEEAPAVAPVVADIKYKLDGGGRRTRRKRRRKKKRRTRKGIHKKRKTRKHKKKAP